MSGCDENCPLGNHAHGTAHLTFAGESAYTSDEGGTVSPDVALAVAQMPGDELPRLDWRHGQFCRWVPVIGSRKPDDMRCPECGHSDLIHIGTDHCPVCELLYQATPQFRRQQMRIAGIPQRDMW
jgi:hypothetical protein